MIINVEFNWLCASDCHFLKLKQEVDKYESSRKTPPPRRTPPPKWTTPPPPSPVPSPTIDQLSSNERLPVHSPPPTPSKHKLMDKATITSSAATTKSISAKESNNPFLLPPTTTTTYLWWSNIRIRSFLIMKYPCLSLALTNYYSMLDCSNFLLVHRLKLITA